MWRILQACRVRRGMESALSRIRRNRVLLFRSIWLSHRLSGCGEPWRMRMHSEDRPHALLRSEHERARVKGDG